MKHNHILGIDDRGYKFSVEYVLHGVHLAVRNPETPLTQGTFWLSLPDVNGAVKQALLEATVR